MYEYLIHKISDDDILVIYGYSFLDACNRWNIINPNEWYIEYTEYVD